MWSYTTREGEVVRRSEGLAVASLDMFLAGLFSDDSNTPHQVTGLLSVSHKLLVLSSLTSIAAGLQALDVQRLSDAFQVTTENPMSGLEGRCNLLLRLGNALDQSSVFHGKTSKRPGHMLGEYTLIAFVGLLLIDRHRSPQARV